MKLEKAFLKSYLEKFDETPFTIHLDDEDIKIGTGEPCFEVTVHEGLDKKALLTSTSLALGEAYMDKVLEIHGDRCV